MSDDDKRALTRRALFKSVVAGTAFSVPLMMSFGKHGIEIESASAQTKKKAAKKKAATKKKARRKKK